MRLATAEVSDRTQVAIKLFLVVIHHLFGKYIFVIMIRIFFSFFIISYSFVLFYILWNNGIE